jgi:hypothetical protein
VSNVARTGQLRLKHGVEWQHVEDEVVVLDLDASVYLAVNDTGAMLWPLVAKGTTQHQLVEELTTRFQIGDDDARADVAAFVDQLRSLTLVEEA